jgi:hypothetical protein
VASGSRHGDGARGRVEEEARHEAAACDWLHGSPVLVAASRAGACNGAERGKEEKSDFTSSMGHNGEGIRVTRRLEAVGGARGRGQTVGRGGHQGWQ